MQYANKRLSKKSIMRYNDAIKSLVTYLSVNNQELTLDNVKLWLATIRNSNTFSVCFFAVKSYLLEMYKDKPATERLELREFFESVSLIKPNKSISQIEYLTKDQVFELVDASSKRIGCFIMALFQTGCRVSELTEIKLDCCKIHKKYVYIDIVGKGNKEREIKLTKKLFSKIRSLFKGNYFLFETSYGQQFKREYISREIKKIAQKLGYEQITSKSLRHSKAMFLKEERGYTPDEVAHALGHSNSLTTMQYYFHPARDTDDELGVFL